MSFYVQEPLDGGWPPLWQIDDRIATRVGIHQPRGANRFEAKDGETPFDVMRRETPWFGIAGHCPFHPISLGPGQYYPRMARPTEGVTALPRVPGFLGGGTYELSYPGLYAEWHVASMSLGRTKALSRRLARICQTVHPAADCREKIYGNDIADLLISACMEFETQCRGILRANSYPRPSNKCKTPDYVRLLSPLKLAEYAIGFIPFPWLSPERPFEAWDTKAPTETLPWYQAYHDVKHDREANFSQGTLAHAFRAVSACAIIILAQYGEHWHDVEFWSYFWKGAIPSWSLTERYFQPLTELMEDGVRRGDWTPVNYSF